MLKYVRCGPISLSADRVSSPRTSGHYHPPCRLGYTSTVPPQRETFKPHRENTPLRARTGKDVLVPTRSVLQLVPSGLQWYRAPTPTLLHVLHTPALRQSMPKDSLFQALQTYFTTGKLNPPLQPQLSSAPVGPTMLTQAATAYTPPPYQQPLPLPHNYGPPTAQPTHQAPGGLVPPPTHCCPVHCPWLRVRRCSLRT
jgi:hypothetical protein